MHALWSFACVTDRLPKLSVCLSTCIFFFCCSSCIVFFFQYARARLFGSINSTGSTEKFVVHMKQRNDMAVEPSKKKAVQRNLHADMVMMEDDEENTENNRLNKQKLVRVALQGLLNQHTTSDYKKSLVKMALRGELSAEDEEGIVMVVDESNYVGSSMQGALVFRCSQCTYVGERYYHAGALMLELVFVLRLCVFDATYIAQASTLSGSTSGTACPCFASASTEALRCSSWGSGSGKLSGLLLLLLAARAQAQSKRISAVMGTLFLLLLLLLRRWKQQQKKKKRYHSSRAKSMSQTSRIFLLIMMSGGSRSSSQMKSMSRTCRTSCLLILTRQK